MNDLDLIQRFRADVPAPDDERVRAARARLIAEIRAAADTPTAGRRDRREHSGKHRPELPGLECVRAHQISSAVIPEMRAKRANSDVHLHMRESRRRSRRVASFR